MFYKYFQKFLLCLLLKIYSYLLVLINTSYIAIFNPKLSCIHDVLIVRDIYIQGWSNRLLWILFNNWSRSLE